MPGQIPTGPGQSGPSYARPQDPSAKKQWYQHWWVWFIAALVVLGLLLSFLLLAGSKNNSANGTRSTQGDTTSTSTREDAADDSADADADADSDSDDDSNNGPAAEGQAKFGETYSWPDGIEVSVAAPTEHTPSEYADVPEGTTPLVFEVTVTNGTDSTIEGFNFHDSVASGGKEAQTFYDFESDIDNHPSTKITPGKSLTYKAAYAVADPADVQFFWDVYNPDYTLEDQEVFFTH